MRPLNEWEHSVNYLGHYKREKRPTTIYRLPVLMLMVALAVVGCATAGEQEEKDASPSEEVSLRVSGSGTALPLVEKLAEAYSQEHPEIGFQFDPGTNSSGAIEGLLAGNLDLAVANRPLEEDEAEEPLVYSTFAQDAVVFVAYRNEKVEGLSTQQIQDVYSGKVTDWSELGGSAGEIVVLDRDADESARKLVLVPFMDDRPVEARTVVLDRAGEMVEAIKTTPNSIGYSSLGLILKEQDPNLQILALDGVVPTPEAVEDGEYPWYLTFGLIHNDNILEEVREFVAFASGPEGRRIAEENGYTGI